MIGVGVVIRHWTCSVLLSLMKSLKDVVDLTVVEMRNLLKAILLCRDLGFTNYSFEGDSSKAVAAIKNSSLDFGIFTSLIFYINYLLTSMSRKIRHIKLRLKRSSRSPNCSAFFSFFYFILCIFFRILPYEKKNI